MNECNATDEGGCAQKCVNELYSYHCECNSGYRLMADNASCIGKGQWAMQLLYTSSFSCRCAMPHAHLKVTFLDVDECSEGRPCHQLCNNTEGSFFCECEGGFKLRLIDNRTCERMCRL